MIVVGRGSNSKKIGFLIFGFIHIRKSKKPKTQTRIQTRKFEIQISTTKTRYFSGSNLWLRVKLLKNSKQLKISKESSFKEIIRKRHEQRERLS